MTSSSRVPFALLLGASLLWLGASMTAGGGTSQPQDPKSILDRIYSVAQAERGEGRFKVSCSSCHTPGEFGGGAFAERWSGQTMGEVFEYVSSTMPQNDPGGLKPEEYASVLAYILRMNAYPAGSDDMPADKDVLAKFQIVSNPK
jgi:S-disulfanyl-L-cysteine oxidoreductase SoxD